MKKNVLALLFLTASFMTARAGYVPIAVTSGFNADLIANGVGSSTGSSDAFDVPNDYAFIAANFQATASSPLPTSALPVSGTITSAASAGLNFQLSDYSSSNALLLSSATGSGTLDFTTSGVAELYVLVSAANGDAEFSATIHFSDASSQTINSLNASDWFNNPGYAIKGISRIARSSDNIEASTDNPRLYQVVLALDPANYSKTITGVTFNSTISGTGTMAVFAITSNTACTGTPLAGTAQASVPSACVGVAFDVSLSGQSAEGGLTYQWETSDDNVSWTPVATGGDGPVLTTTQTDATYYHCIITCQASGLSATSAALQVGQNLPSQCYCIPVYFGGCESFGDFYDINSVQLTGENGTAISNAGTGCSGTGYTDYSYSVAPVDLLPYSNYTLNITTQNPYSTPWATVWIDLNDDGQFDNATEQAGTTGDNPGTSLALSIPLAPAGQHKMRVRTVWYNYAEVDEPCDGGYYNGEAEDYTINMLPVPSCIHPLNIAAGNISSNGTADVSWSVVSAGASYDWVIDQSATNAPSSTTGIANTTDTSVSVSGMFGGINYFHVRSHCSATDSSVWTAFMISVPSSCENAQLIPCGGSVSGNNTGQPETVLPAQSCGNDEFGGGHYQGIWYKIVPSESGDMTVSTCGNASWDTYLRVYEGECGDFVSCMGYSDDYCNSQSSVTFTATSGTSYYILLAGWSTSSFGAFTLTTTCPQPTPANDEAPGAIELALGSGCSGAAYSSAGATSSSGEPYPDCNGGAGTHSVWFKFTAPNSGAVKISTDFAAGTLTNSKMALFTVGDPTDYGTFNEIACDEDNGVNGSGNMSVIYSTGLTSGTTYYVAVDGSASSDQGTFCISVDEINPTMLSTAAVSCGSLQQPAGTNGAYTGWITLVDGNGNLVALVRNPAGSAPSDFTGSYNVNSGTIRQDANGIYYLDRNYFINNPAISTPVDVQFFFSPGEIGYLSGITSATANPVTMSNLNVTKQEGSVCVADYSEGEGPVSVLVQNANGTANGVGWIQVSTSSFSNFYLMGGTVPLFVELQNISATNEGSRNRVDWTTAKEDKGDFFELQRSADGRQFSFLATVAAKGQPSGYTYYDNSPLQGVSYYRLKMADAEGKAVYSAVVSATVGLQTGFDLQAYPNPATGSLSVEIAGTRSADAALAISDATGRVLRTIPVTDSKMKVDMSSLSQGFYLIEYRDAQNHKTIRVGKQ